MLDSHFIDQEFPQQTDLIYLNHAAVAPWPARTHAAVTNFAQENMQLGASYYPKWMEVETQLRQQMAKLINAPSVDEIALVKNTSEALSFVAFGLSWQAGDNVVISNQEFPSNRIVWEALKRYGVEVRAVDLNQADTPEQALINACDQQTRLLSISSVQYATGLRIQLPLLGEHCQQHDILFCVDAIQSIGALQFDVQAIQADFVMADGHKWMLGPEGIGLFYCRAERLNQLTLHEYGWHMIQDMGNYLATDWEVATTARRFECGSPNMLGIHALYASLSLLLEIGMEKVEQAILNHTQMMIDYITHSKQLELITNADLSRSAGIVTFRSHRQDSPQLYQKLMQNKVICANRGGGVRYSPHFYSDPDKISHALKLAS